MEEEGRGGRGGRRWLRWEKVVEVGEEGGGDRRMTEVEVDEKDVGGCLEWRRKGVGREM